jgi:hypothetical protein
MISTPTDIKPIIDPNTGEEMTADRLQNLKPTIFGTPMLEGADVSNIPVYTPPTASSMPTFIPQSVSQAVGNVPAYTPPAGFNPFNPTQPDLQGRPPVYTMPAPRTSLYAAS